VPPSPTSRPELRALAAGLLNDDATARDHSIDFVLEDSRGHGHNRIRALMCRRLKHCKLTESQSRRLFDKISERLIQGNFTEQFKDQLRLARHLDAAKLHQTAQAALKIPKDHVRRYAYWILEASGNTC
jgi:hypothetical protein